jgi:hypothetical protein
MQLCQVMAEKQFTEVGGNFGDLARCAHRHGTVVIGNSPTSATRPRGTLSP